METVTRLRPRPVEICRLPALSGPAQRRSWSATRRPSPSRCRGDPLADGTPHRAWAEQVYADLADHAVEGGYANLIGPDQAAQADATYGPNGRRLLEVKRRYDPHNVCSATQLPSTDSQ